MKHVVENTLFIMPEDRELMFPAVAVMQAYVNDFQQTMRSNSQLPLDQVSFHLRYQVQMNYVDWGMFRRCGLELVQEPVAIGSPDVVIDMTDDRINSYMGMNKHACQACGITCGIETKPFPVIKKKELGINWLTSAEIGGCVYIDFGYTIVDESGDLSWLYDVDVIGVLAKAGPLTYMAASMGLAVIEIVPDRPRNRNWLSKWTNPLYRAIANTPRLHEDIIAAKNNLEGIIHTMQNKERFDKDRKNVLLKQ